MSKRPTKIDLEKRIQELEQERKIFTKVTGKGEERYRTIFEYTGNATILIAEDTTILLANSNFARLAGYTREEMEGKMSWTSLIAPEDLPLMKQYHAERRVKTDSAPNSYEFRLRTRTGEIRNILLTVALEPGTKESVASCMDITDRKRVEKELLENREVLLKEQSFNRLLLDASPVFIVAIDLQGRLIMMNRAMLEALNYRHEDIKGADYFSTFVPEADRNALADVFFRIIQHRSFTSNENRVLSSSGEEILVQWHGRLAPSDNSDNAFFVGIGIDITERKKAEDALKQSEERFRDMARLLPETVFEADTTGRVTFVNEISLGRFGFTQKDIEKGISIFDVVAPEEHKRARANFEKVIRGEHIGLSEYLARKKNGAIFPALVHSTRFLKDGKPAGSRGFLVDISEKKAMEDQLLRAQKLEAIGTLAGGIAHDFNNLLMGILGNLSLMLMHLDETHPFHDRLKSMEEYVQRGSDLTRQLLGFARGGKYEVRTTNLGKFVLRSAEMFGRTKKEIAIHHKMTDGLWYVDVDRGQMDQVLLNLFVNAWQSMPHGGNLYTSVENVELSKEDVIALGVTPGKFVKLTVTDTGVGMDDTTKSHIFEPFFSTKDRGRGTGLGLASVYGIIKNHGGLIGVESEKGVGTSFIIHLPASDKKAEDVPGKESQLHPGKETILLIDDEEMILDVGAQMLEGLGYKVLTAGGGRQGIHIFQQNREIIDLVILDMIMPDLGGKETFKALHHRDPSIKVLLSSGYSLDSEAKHIIAEGCKGFIQKPFTMAGLSGKIREILENRS